MAAPNSKATLTDHCLRALGYPVIEINVDDDQVEDRIDEALQFYQEYHADAIEKVYLKHLVTKTDQTYSGSLCIVIPGARILKIVVIKLIAPKIEAAPDK